MCGKKDFICNSNAINITPMILSELKRIQPRGFYLFSFVHPHNNVYTVAVATDSI